MEAVSEPTEVPQEPTEVPQEVRVKRPRTEAQMLALARAREQAVTVRQQNADLRRKQVEIDRAHAAKTRQEENDRIEREFAALSQPPPSPPSPPEPEEAPRAPPEEAPRRKRKPARRVVVTEASSASESEDEVEVTLPRARKAPTREEVLYQKTMAKLFEVA